MCCCWDISQTADLTHIVRVVVRYHHITQNADLTHNVRVVVGSCHIKRTADLANIVRVVNSRPFTCVDSVVLHDVFRSTGSIPS